MTQLGWLTPTGSTVANLLVGISASVKLQAYDIHYTDVDLTYSVISGTLPAGITLSSDGTLSGTPLFSGDSNNNYTNISYTFIVRVVSSTGAVLDGQFQLLVSNSINGDFAWITPTGDLGTIPGGEFYSYQLQAAGPSNTTISYSLVSGDLPAGMYLVPGGELRGVPTFLTSVKVDQSKVYRFTVRATSSSGRLIDRSFSLTITSVYGPVIEPSSAGTRFLGTFFDGSFYTQQLTVFELNPNVQIEWSVSDGALPTGITIDSTGLLSGYIQPLQLVGAFGPGGFDGDAETLGIVSDQQEYDYAPYDFNQLNQSAHYTFTIQAFDGANTDIQRYDIEVISRANFTADSTNMVNDSYLTVDSLNVYIPVLLNASSTLPTGRQNSYYAYKFDGFDFSGDALTYAISATSGTFDAGGFDPLFDVNFPPNGNNPANNGLPGSFDLVSESNSNLPGLFLDAQTGWLYGKINPQTIAYKEYSFGVQATKVKNGIKYTSVPIYFTLPVLGDVNNIIEWVSPSNLGTVNNGSVSELSVVAKSVAGKNLVYSLYDHAGTPARLPQGLELLPSGDLSGRVSFEAFSIDDYATTFDGGKLTVDRTYTFTAVATTEDGTASSYKEFTLNLKIIDTEPYDNLYLKAMPEFDQRQIYNSVVSDKTIFPTELIYRAQDPWFGVNPNMEMLFMAGLKPDTINAFEEAIVKNHWTKLYNFDGIATAVVLDDFYNIKYEVVYVNIIDPGQNLDGTGPASTLDLTGTIANPYIDAMGVDHKILYPNSTSNMIAEFENNIGFADRSSLPPWMTSNQLDPANPGKFKPPLGFVKAVVLAYTVPGASKLIAYRLRNAGINFHNIQFSVDRYQVDNYYTTNYSLTSNSFVSGSETTFDALPTKNVGTVVAKVNYAVEIPFDQINGRPLSYIQGNGGLDGVMNFTDGDTLIFAKQEGFLNPGPYDGWVDYTDAYIGDNITTTAIEGYGSESYDTYNIIPGYAESSQASIKFTGDGITQTFYSTQNFNTAVSVYVNGLIQPASNYTITTNSISFVAAPPVPLASNTIKNITVYHNSNGSQDQFTGTGAQNTFVMSSPAANNYALTVLVNGQLQDNTTYSVAGNNIIFNTPPSAPAKTPNIEIVSNINQRGGVWKVNIVNNVIYLTFVKQVAINQRIQVINGKSHSGSILYYNPVLIAGQTVPYYETYHLSLNAVKIPTTFNAGTTKFFSNRDRYYTPGTQDKYLKFPQFGVFK